MKRFTHTKDNGLSLIKAEDKLSIFSKEFIEIELEFSHVKTYLY